MSDTPFNARDFCGFSLRRETSDVEELINFEKIVKEKYPDRVFYTPFINIDDIRWKAISISAKIESTSELITIFMEILVTTNNKIYAINYTNLLSRVAYYAIK